DRKTRDNHNSRAPLRPDNAAIVDEDRRLVLRRIRKEVPLPFCSCHGRSLPGSPEIEKSVSKKADRFGSPPSPAAEPVNMQVCGTMSGGLDSCKFKACSKVAGV